MDMNQIMQQARRMQAQLAATQDRLPDITVTASAGGGAVKVTASADMQVTDIEIAPEAVDPEDVELLQDMILAAVNDALKAAGDAANEQLSAVTGGLNIPGVFR